MTALAENPLFPVSEKRTKAFAEQTCSTVGEFRVGNRHDAAMPLMDLLHDYVLVHAGLDFSRDDPVSES